MELTDIIAMLDALVNDPTIPKNIRKALSDAKARLEGDEELSVKVGAAIYLIESVMEDINMPPHARTQIWSIMSALEEQK